jgi:hypothetical protein
MWFNVYLKRAFTNNLRVRLDAPMGLETPPLSDLFLRNRLNFCDLWPGGCLIGEERYFTYIWPNRPIIQKVEVIPKGLWYDGSRTRQR